MCVSWNSSLQTQAGFLKEEFGKAVKCAQTALHFHCHGWCHPRPAFGLFRDLCSWGYTYFSVHSLQPLRSSSMQEMSLCLKELSWLVVDGSTKDLAKFCWILELCTFENGNLKINMGLGMLTKLTLHSCSHPASNESFLFSTRMIIIIIYAPIRQIKQIAFVLLGWVLDSACIPNTSQA